MSMMIKMTILTQEVCRRLHNTKEDVPDDVKNEILNKYRENLKLSGYSEKKRLKIHEGGFKTFQNLKDKEEAGDRPFYRPPS